MAHKLPNATWKFGPKPRDYKVPTAFEEIFPNKTRELDSIYREISKMELDPEVLPFIEDRYDNRLMVLYLESFFLPGINYPDGLDESTKRDLPPDKLHLLRDLEETPYKYYLMAEDLVIGYAYAKLLNGENYRIVSAMVHPLFRNQGFGTRLILALFRDARDTPAKYSTLNAWPTPLPYPYHSPIKFWEFMGFRRITRDEYYLFGLHKKGNPVFGEDGTLEVIENYYSNGMDAVQFILYF